MTQKQPRYIPLVASDGGVYSAPATEWDGDPIIVEPNLGTQAAGLTPGPASWFAAETANFLLNSFGAHLTAIADAPSFARTAQAALFGGGANNSLSNYGDTSTANGNGTNDPPLLFAAKDDVLLVQQADLPSADGQGFIRTREGQGLQNAGSGDTSQWHEGAMTGVDLTPAESGHACVLVADRTSGTVIACGGTLATQYTTDYGETWTDGPALPPNAHWHNPLVGCVMGGLWYVVDDVSVTSTVNRLVHTTDPTAVAWAEASGSMGGSGSDHVRRILQNGSILVLLPATNTKIAYYEPGGTATVTEVVLTGSADSSRTGWRGAWNDQIGLFMLGNFQGDLWTSPDGKAWTQILINDATLVLRDIVSHGRGFVVSNSAVEWAVEFMAQAHDGTWPRQKILSAFQGNSGPANAFHLASIGGRWVAARVIKNSTWELEWYTGGVNPYDRNSYVGR